MRGRITQDKAHSRFFHFPSGEFPQRRRHLRQYLWARMNNRYSDVFFFDVIEETTAAAHEIVDFAGHFDATEAATNDDEGQIDFLLLQVVADFSFFHLLHDMCLERERITNGLETMCVLVHAGNQTKIC